MSSNSDGDPKDLSQMLQDAQREIEQLKEQIAELGKKNELLEEEVSIVSRGGTVVAPVTGNEWVVIAERRRCRTTVAIQMSQVKGFEDYVKPLKKRISLQINNSMKMAKKIVEEQKNKSIPPEFLGNPELLEIFENLQILEELPVLPGDPEFYQAIFEDSELQNLPENPEEKKTVS